MNTRLIIGLWALTLLCPAYGQKTSFEKFERYFTWDPDSTSIYSQPDLESEELTKLPYGTEVERLNELHEPKVNVFIGEIEVVGSTDDRGGGYVLPTFWVEVEYGNLKGYALNAEVINFPPMRYEHQMYSLETENLGEYFEQPVIDTVYTQQWNDTEMKMKYTRYEFPDGSLMVYKSMDGCIDREIVPNSERMAQAYMMLKTWHFVPKNQYFDKARQRILFTGLVENKLTFRAPHLSDYQNPYIEFLPDGKLKIGGSACN